MQLRALLPAVAASTTQPQLRLRSALMSTGSSPVSISSAFDGGNILLLGTEGAAVKLEIKPDPYTELEKTHHSQWFSFRALVTKYLVSLARFACFESH